VIERLLAAERALAGGDLDQAERLFGQVAEADQRNAIALAGLAAVARRRGDDAGARDLAARALAIDPEEAAAARLAGELGAVADPRPGSVGGSSGPAAAPARGGLLGWLQRLLGRAR
jgi:tetratricopeptide (TPR) repeat protein